MQPDPLAQRITRVMEAVLAAIFLVLIVLPLADSALKLDRAATLNEKRLPARFPEFAPGWGGLRAFLTGLEAYYADHFGFRTRLLHWEHQWKRDLFHESTVSDVMIGRGGWLFVTGGHMIDDWRGTRPLTPRELQEWQTLLEKRRDWLARRGIRYLFVITPSKETVYPEFLPEWMARVGPVTRLDQFFTHMKAHSTVEVLDLRPALIQAKQTARTYLITDAHWNLYGAFIGYQEIIHALHRQLPDLDEPLPLAAFETRYADVQGGDLATMLGQEQSLRESDYVNLIPRPPLQRIENKVDTNILNKKWRLLMEPVYSENPAQKYKAVFFRDSFCEFLKPFLGYHFKRVVYIWLETWDLQVIEREQPDVVVDQIVEHGFNEERASSLIRADALP